MKVKSLSETQNAKLYFELKKYNLWKFKLLTASH